MKKLAYILSGLLAAANVHAAAPAPDAAKPETKADIQKQIDTVNSIIKMLTGMKKDFAKMDPSSTAGYDLDIANARKQLADLQVKIKTAPSK